MELAVHGVAPFACKVIEAFGNNAEYSGNNEHDRWAVAVCTTDNRDIGYITRFKNETIARLMDLSRQFKAYVAEKPKDETERRRTTAPTENFEIPMDVYMVER
ncbi:MAG: hypothetical protein IJ050_05730 [Clostridia bacterium]|nr:hypothetical protein [Clostridia bacterium]